MSSSRYGVELAYALFTVCFYNHNERMASPEKKIAYPVEFYQGQNDSHLNLSEKFGLSFKPKNDASCSVPTDLDINSNTYSDLYSRITATPLYHFKEESIVSISDDHCSDEDTDTVVAESGSAEGTSIVKLKAILMKA